MNVDSINRVITHFNVCCVLRRDFDRFSRSESIIKDLVTILSVGPKIIEA